VLAGATDNESVGQGDLSGWFGQAGSSLVTRTDNASLSCHRAGLRLFGESTQEIGILAENPRKDLIPNLPVLRRPQTNCVRDDFIDRPTV
jgi:hypothetical protein